MNKDITIIGGGPVGLALALTLATKYRVGSLVIEKRLGPTPMNESRAIIWMPKGIEFLDWLGLLETFQRNSTTRTFHQFLRHGKPILTLDFNLSDSKFKKSLNLPQHLTEKILEDEVMKHSDLIEVRRGHELVSVKQSSEDVSINILNIPKNEQYEIISKILIGCDGAKSTTRELSEIKLIWNDYGTNSAVADIEANLTNENTDVSWIELDYKRPYGLFNFHPNKWRIIYRVNGNEKRDEVITPNYVDKLIKEKFPQIYDYKFLWASAFRLGQGQSTVYSKGRIVLAGDAAHPMGPSAGAGMMVGMLGVWRLAWRLKQSVETIDTAKIAQLFAGYEDEQREGSKTIQSANATTFAQIALKNPILAFFRRIAFGFISKIPSIQRKMVVIDTLTNQTINSKKQ